MGMWTGTTFEGDLEDMRSEMDRLKVEIEQLKRDLRQLDVEIAKYRPRDRSIPPSFDELVAMEMEADGLNPHADHSVGTFENYQRRVERRLAQRRLEGAYGRIHRG